MRTLARIGFVLASLALSAVGGCVVEAADQNGGDANDDDRTDGGANNDAGVAYQNDAGNRPDQPAPTPMPQTEVPDELVGAWQSSAIDFALWENYTEGYYAGRNAVPSREAMVFAEDGDAKFYRYEFAFTLYEELIDCEGTVAFHGDGTFTFYPVQGRKRFYDFRHSENDADRPLTAEELIDAKLAGRRAYTYVADSTPGVLRITVPGSAPYNWYKQE